MVIVQSEHISYQYGQHNIHQPLALNDVSFTLEQGLFTAVLGSTGSGKSTLMQHLNGIYQPMKGKLQVYDVTFEGGKKVKGLKHLRSRVGLVFQFPEQQLFEETLEKDLMFGPIQFGKSKEEAHAAAVRALQAVGLSEELLDRSPFELSGGQMRKAAIATVLASDPDLLVLDEPTATLDPVSRYELIGLLKRLSTEQGKTIVMVTHRLDEALEAADRFIFMKQGALTFHGTREELLQEPDILQDAGILMPETMQLALLVHQRTGVPYRELPSRAEDWADWIAARLSVEGTAANSDSCTEEVTVCS